MSEAQKKADKKCYQNKIAGGWVKFSKWIHPDKVEPITANEINAFFEKRTEKAALIRETSKLKSVKGE